MPCSSPGSVHTLALRTLLQVTRTAQSQGTSPLGLGPVAGFEPALHTGDLFGIYSTLQVAWGAPLGRAQVPQQLPSAQFSPSTEQGRHRNICVFEAGSSPFPEGF